MQILNLEYALFLSLMLGGTILLTGFLPGIAHSKKQIWGCESGSLLLDAEGNIGLLPLSLLRIGIFSVVGAWLWFHFTNQGEHIIYGLIAGGGFGLLVTGYFQKIQRLNGIRYCERCRQEVEDTQEPGIVIFIFGKIPYQPDGRVFLLRDPDFEQHSKFIEVSEVYIIIPAPATHVSWNDF